MASGASDIPYKFFQNLVQSLGRKMNLRRRLVQSLVERTHTHTHTHTHSLSVLANLVSYRILQVMEWRKDQARREEEAEELTSGGRHGSRQAVNVRKRGRHVSRSYENHLLGGNGLFLAYGAVNRPRPTVAIHWQQRTSLEASNCTFTKTELPLFLRRKKAPSPALVY